MERWLHTGLPARRSTTTAITWCRSSHRWAARCSGARAAKKWSWVREISAAAIGSSRWFEDSLLPRSIALPNHFSATTIVNRQAFFADLRALAREKLLGLGRRSGYGASGG